MKFSIVQNALKFKKWMKKHKVKILIIFTILMVAIFLLIFVFGNKIIAFLFGFSSILGFAEIKNRTTRIKVKEINNTLLELDKKRDKIKKKRKEDEKDIDNMPLNDILDHVSKKYRNTRK